MFSSENNLYGIKGNLGLRIKMIYKEFCWPNFTNRSGHAMGTNNFFTKSLFCLAVCLLIQCFPIINIYWQGHVLSGCSIYIRYLILQFIKHLTWERDQRCQTTEFLFRVPLFRNLPISFFCVLTHCTSISLEPNNLLAKSLVCLSAYLIRPFLYVSSYISL